MAKAMILLDTIPECCMDCKLYRDDLDVCVFLGKVDDEDYSVSRPDYQHHKCPIVNLPFVYHTEGGRKEEEKYAKYKEGWNDCVFSMARQKGSDSK